MKWWQAIKYYDDSKLLKGIIYGKQIYGINSIQYINLKKIIEKNNYKKWKTPRMSGEKLQNGKWYLS